jgi:hypothetical protein
MNLFLLLTIIKDNKLHIVIELYKILCFINYLHDFLLNFRCIEIVHNLNRLCVLLNLSNHICINNNDKFVPSKSFSINKVFSRFVHSNCEQSSKKYS